jgi:AsmA protein
MNKYVKYGLWTFAGLLALSAALVAYITLTFDPNAYKAQIIQAVRDSKQRTLKLDGDIKLHFFPSIGMSLSKVSLSEFRSEQEFAAVDSASVSLKLLPLLARQIVVDEVEVSGVKAHLIKYKNGKTNLDDLLGEESAPTAPASTAPAPSSATAGTPMAFDIASVQLDRTDLSYSDERSGTEYSVKDLKLQTGRIANDTPSKIDFSAHIESNKPNLNIAVRIKTNLIFNLDERFFHVQGLDLQADGNALDITGLNVKAGGDASARLATYEFSMKKFALAASGIKGKDKFEAGFNAPGLTLTKTKFTADNVTVNAKLDAALGNIVAGLTLPGIEGSANSFKVSKAMLDVDVTQPEQTFKLKLTSPVTGSIKAQQFNLSNLALALNASGDKLPGKTISSEMKGSVQADLDRQYVEVNLAGGLLQSQLKAKASVKNFSVPMIRYDLELDKFDADPYLPQKTAQTRGQGKSTSTPPEQPFDLSALKTLNLEGSLRVGSFKADNVKVAQLRVDVKARNGLINIAPLSAKLYQGKVDGRASINAATSSFAINEKLTGVDTAPLLKDAADLELAEGRGNVAFDLTTQGNTVSALKKALNGKASVDLANGAIKGINLDKLVQGLQNLSKESSTQTLGVDKNEKTPFSEFKASFKVHNGVAHNNDLAVKSTVLRVTGKGDIDIGRDDMDYNAKVIFAKTEKGKTGTLPVNVSGAFDALKFKVDYGALLADVARQRLNEKKEELRAKAKEEAKTKLQNELKNGLKGLFK